MNSNSKNANSSASEKKSTEAAGHQELENIEVDLREPLIGALLAWLWPGAGHIYQRRYRKGALFMICILSTFFFGLILGNGHVVYASWRPNDYRWQAIPQFGIGLPAFPAAVQNMKVRDGSDPYMITARRYPPGHPKQYLVIPPEEYEKFKKESLADGFMAPPAGQLFTNNADVLAMWTAETKHGFELGTLYTVVAGLLNILAIYDAFAGPVLPSVVEEKEDEKKKKKSPENEPTNSSK